MRRQPLDLLVALTAFVAIGAKVYRWVDEKGITHYSETPPSGHKAQEAPVRSPSAGAGSAEPAEKTWQQKDQEFQERRRVRDETERQQEEERRKQEIVRRERCLQAQRDLHVLQLGRPVYTIDEKGERVFLEDSARPSGVADAKERVRIYCEPRQ